MGLMKSTMLAVLEVEVLVLTMMEATPMERQGSKLPSSAVKSMAASTNWLAP